MESIKEFLGIKGNIVVEGKKIFVVNEQKKIDTAETKKLKDALKL